MKDPFSRTETIPVDIADMINDIYEDNLRSGVPNAFVRMNIQQDRINERRQQLIAKLSAAFNEAAGLDQSTTGDNNGNTQ